MQWLHQYNDRSPSGRPDPTINLESLPKSTSRVLIQMYRAATVLEDPRAWATDVLLSRLLERMKRERTLMYAALSDVFVGQHASLATLDVWEASEDPKVRKLPRLVSSAIDWLAENVPEEWTIEVQDDPDAPPKVVTERVWLAVPTNPEYDKADWAKRTPREVQRARREMARSLHLDFLKRAEAEGLNGSANKQAVEQTAEATGYSAKEIYKILAEARI